MKDRIKQIRKHLNMNQAEFANDLGISVSNIQSYETGRRLPSDAFIKLVCEKYGVNIEWLSSAEGEMLKPKTRESEIADIVDQMLDSQPDDLRLRITKVLYSLNDAQLEVLAKIGKEMFGNENSPGE